MASMSLLSLILALLGCLPLLQGQQQLQHAVYPAWLYSMPWRPLVPSTPQQSPLSQLSPGYTGPQTFPSVQREREREQRQEKLLEPEQELKQGLFTPQIQFLGHTGPPVQGRFSLPFRPSPFSGYTDDDDEDPGGGSLEEPAREIERVGPFVYLSPGRLYNIFRS
ncbi:uncharacterized protein [Drosophila pseudoobscura]|uniref:Uncharacterized protein n=1 Tax=Drosophila pseudoobscura pseudoobscura TaxID=46245 RepID=A0A6I8WA70_DROPS|nr:uncharacterized protein LOC4815579 [Drosophila pseudoobscura]